MSRKWLIALIAAGLIIPIVAVASFRGKLLKMGIDSDYANIVVEGDVTSGDDVIVGDDCVITGLATIGETLVVTGVVDLNSTCTLSVLSEHKARILSFTGAKTLTAAMSGAVISNQDASTSNVLTLPTAVAGLTYTFLDVEAAAGSDLWITAGTGDKINGGTAKKSYVCTGDAVKQHCTIVAIDAELWEITAENGSWANDNN